MFYYVASGTYCRGSEFKYLGTVAKNVFSIVLEICPTPNPTLNLIVLTNAKLILKLICWCKRAVSTSLRADLNCFVETWLHRIRTGAPHLSIIPIHLIGSLSSPPVSGVWWAHTLDWLYDSLSPPPVSGVWWAHWRCCTVAAVASSVDDEHWWWLRRDPPPPPPHDRKALWVYSYTQ